MPSAQLTIPATAEHVRTARLVAVAAARRAGLEEETVDDVRLAVGELVALSVLRLERSGSDAEIDLVLRETERGFEVDVVTRGSDAPVVSGYGPDPDEDAGDDELALTLVRALAPAVRVDGALTTLGWPRDEV